MKAVRVHELGKPVRVDDIEEPRLRPGSVILKILSAHIPAFMPEVLNHGFPFPMPKPPFTPGLDAIGIVEAVADDVDTVSVGDKVYFDPVYTPPGGTPLDGCFVAFFSFSFSKAAQAVIEHWGNGTYAEKMLAPAECLTPLGRAADQSPAVLSRLGFIGAGYGGLLRGGFQPGDTLLVNGGTGTIGLGAVLSALAMGATRVVAVGRKKSVLDRLKQLDSRIDVVQVGNGAEADAKAIKDTAGEVDMMIDAIANTSDPSATMGSLGALRFQGTAVMLGGLNATLPIDYQEIMLGRELCLRGCGWFPRAAMKDLLEMIASGLIDLSSLTPHTYALDEAPAAMEKAASHPAGFEHVTLMPN